MNVGMQHIAIKAPFEMQHVIYVLSLLALKDKRNVWKRLFYPWVMISTAGPTHEKLHNTFHAHFCCFIPTCCVIIRQPFILLFLLWPHVSMRHLDLNRLKCSE